jgi:hypothetical protein
MNVRLFDIVLGVLGGFAFTYMAAFPLALLAPLADAPRGVLLALTLLGAVLGGVLGAKYHSPAGEGGTVARWCVGMAFGLGAVAFLAGFVGPILFSPDSPQGPLLGIFITGPLGVVAGALLGLVIGLARRGRAANGSSPP